MAFARGSDEFWALTYAREYSVQTLERHDKDPDRVGETAFFKAATILALLAVADAVNQLPLEAMADKIGLSVVDPRG